MKRKLCYLKAFVKIKFLPLIFYSNDIFSKAIVDLFHYNIPTFDISLQYILFLKVEMGGKQKITKMNDESKM